jgi:DNA primase
MKGFAQEAVILFDGDQAGVKAALRAVPLFLSEQLTAKVVILPEKHDPDTYIAEFGREHFEKKITAAVPLPEFVFDRLLAVHGMTLAGKAAIVQELKPIMEAIGDDHLQRTLFVSHFGEKIGLTAEQMLKGLPTASITAPPGRKSVNVQGATKLTKIEEQLLGFLIINPEYVQEFIKAGLEYSIEGESGRTILQHLVAVSQDGGLSGPEQILELTSGPERSFVSKCLIDFPELSDEQREEEAAEKILWLRENSLKSKMRQLTAQINQAQKDNDNELLMKLLKQKNKMREE